MFKVHIGVTDLLGPHVIVIKITRAAERWTSLAGPPTWTSAVTVSRSNLLKTL
jgi:hypothetical protein